MELTTNRMGSLANALRWLQFLRASVVAANVAWYVMTILSEISMGRYNADEAGVLTMLVGGAAMGAAFVFTGSKIAPSQRPFVPWLMCTLNACFYGTVAVPLWLSSRWMDLDYSAATVVAAFVVALVMFKAEQRGSDGDS
jgi:hypothetical protein